MAFMSYDPSVSACAQNLLSGCLYESSNGNCSIDATHGKSIFWLAYMPGSNVSSKDIVTMQETFRVLQRAQSLRV